jgi:hypothetical protein
MRGRNYSVSSTMPRVRRLRAVSRQPLPWRSGDCPEKKQCQTSLDSAVFSTASACPQGYAGAHAVCSPPRPVNQLRDGKSPQALLGFLVSFRSG